MPNYHRADVSFNMHRTFRLKQSNSDGSPRKIRRTINLSVYNLYNHANPYLTYTSSQFTYQGYSRALVQLSIFPILPSVAYTLYF